MDCSINNKPVKLYCHTVSSIESFHSWFWSCFYLLLHFFLSSSYLYPIIVSSFCKEKNNLHQGWAIIFSNGPHQKLELLYCVSLQRYNIVKLKSILLRIIGPTLQNSPEFSCGFLGKWIAHPCLWFSSYCALTY